MFEFPGFKNVSEDTKETPQWSIFRYIEKRKEEQTMTKQTLESVSVSYKVN